MMVAMVANFFWFHPVFALVRTQTTLFVHAFW